MQSFAVDQNQEDKRQLFIDATIASLAEHGYKATTVRKIAQFAGVAPGLLTHYFEGKEVLIAESYAYLARTFLHRFEARIEGMEDEPEKALRTFIEATFDKKNLDPKLLKVWLSFWSLTLAEPDLKHIHQDTYNHYIQAIERMLTQAYRKTGKEIAPEHVSAQAMGINALLDGLWLEWCLDPTAFSPQAGLQIVYDFTENATGLRVRPA